MDLYNYYLLSGDDIGARFRAHVQQRVAVAKRLDAGQCGGSYAEAVLILSSVLSGIAADLWPGEGKDRKRFVELWANFANTALRPNLISVPLLLDRLHDSGEEHLAQKVQATRPEARYSPNEPTTQIVTGRHLDQSEAELPRLDPRLTTKRLRPYSYGNLFYKHVRSGYAHEYHLTDYASRYPAAEEPAPISYVNIISYVDNAIKPQRRIYFSVDWIAHLVESVSTFVEPLLHSLPLQEPNFWWIDG